MELKDVFTIVKADRYTDAGRAEIDDARRTYKPGEISEKTGLQKQSNGTWAPPKKGGNAASKGHLESDTPQNLTITKEDEERFGKAALSGLSGPRESNTGKRTGTPSPETQKEMKLRREAMSGDPEKRKALFSYEASKADDKDIEMVLSAKERGVNHPADKIEAYKAEKERRSGTDVSKLSKEQIKEFRDMTAEQLKTPYSLNSGVSKESYQKNQETLKKRLNEYDAELAKRSGSSDKQKYKDAMTRRDELMGKKKLSDQELSELKESNSTIQKLAKKFVAGDSVPRALTGDCRVRVKK